MSGAGRRGGVVAGGMLLGSLLLGGEAAAQFNGRPPPTPRPTRPVHEAQGDLGRHFGVRVSEKLLASSDANERLQGVRRLASDGSAQAIDLLVRSQEPGNPVARDLRARLEAVRGLGPFVTQDEPRQVVVRALVDGATLAASGHDVALAAMLRDTAAMVIGRHGGSRGADALAGLLQQGGAVGAAAGRALLAYPPERLDALVGGRGAESAELVSLLVRLGDLRAIPLLRRTVRAGEPAVRAASLVGLAELGDGEAPLVAREWVKESDATARVAAIRTLLRTSPGEGRAALARSLGEPAMRANVLGLVREGPGPELVAPLTTMVREPTLDDETRAVVLEALGRCGPGAVATLAGLLPASGAALALALQPTSEARGALEKALGQAGPVRAAALRAGVVRALVLRDAPSGMSDAARAAMKAGGAEAAAGAWARVALGEVDVDEDRLLASPELAGAAARGALGRGDGALEKLAVVMETSGAGATGAVRDALALGLLVRGDGGRLATSTLLGWVDDGGAAAPLAARALGWRDDEVTRPRTTALLRGGDPTVRAHVALGLGQSREADAAGRLAEAYRFEPEVRVRRAIVRALSWRSEAPRLEALTLAASLDVDAVTRTLARAALRGKRAAVREGGDLVAWWQVDEGQARRWERPDGLALPVVADRDGALLVPGLAAAPSRATVPPSAALAASPEP